jgi:two-component system sensor histidine kinase QseC
MLKKFWRAVRTPSLTRRLMLSQLGLMVAIWSVLVVLIIQDIAYTDKWYQPRLMNNRATMILAVAESLQDRPVEQHTALSRIDEFQRNEHREEDSTGVKVTMLVYMGDELIYVTPGERRRVQASKPFVIEHSVQDGRRFRTYMQSSAVSNARVILLLPADPEAVFIALWSRGFLLLPIVITLPILLLPAWFSVWLALKPFRKVAEEVASKGPEDLAPLAFKPKHRELLQMGKAVNGLLERIRTGVERERRFIADAAHELRTPLAAMRINIEALRQRPHDPADAPLLDGLMHSGDRATRLVSQLLSLMRSDAAPAAVSQHALRLDELAQERLAVLGAIARQRDVEIELEAPVPVTVVGERQGLITLIDNLVENAIKYSPAGSSVVVRVAAGAAGSAQLSVEDAGPGVPPDLRERVFERFYRAPDQTQPGSGLGLAIVRSVAEVHHASVSLGEPEGHNGLKVSVSFSPPK